MGQGLQGRYNAVRATDRVGHRYVLDGHTECVVDSLEEIEALLDAGSQVKRQAATAMNERSTRAHTILLLSLKVRGKSPDDRARTSRFYFADLGGSEQLSKSHADKDTTAPVTVVGGVEQSRVSWNEYYSHRQRVQETVNINWGLFALKRVVEALHRRSDLSKQGVAQNVLPYVPYQDSKLTMLLKEVLGGSARTLIIATATMDVGQAPESIQTLRFADTCAHVEKQRRDGNSASVIAALGQIADEIKHLEAEIVRKERWETQRVRRRDVDTVAGAFGGGQTFEHEEVVHKTVLVGAEVERERLEQLLQRQAELQGLGNVGSVFKDYRELQAAEAADGGRGVDFRQRDRFSKQMKAKDFEDEVVVADALRYLFRRTEAARAIFGETDATRSKRLAPDQIPEAYFQVASSLRQSWERRQESGEEHRSFGKATMDQCLALRMAIKANSSCREEKLQTLLRDCGSAYYEKLTKGEGERVTQSPEDSSDGEF